MRPPAPIPPPSPLTSCFRLLALVAAFGLIRVEAAAPETGKEKLRTLIRLPALHMQAGFGFGSVGGFKLLTERRDFPAEIAALRRQVAAAQADGALQFQLGKLLREAGDAPGAVAAFARAGELHRKRLETQPANGPLLTALAEALAETDKTAEAESKFREALRVAPKEWRGWFSFAAFASDQASVWLVGSLDRKLAGVEQLVAHLAKHRPSPEQVRRSQEWMREAKAAFDRAAELAPGEPEVFQRRGLNTGMAAFLANCIAWVSGESELPNLAKNLYSAEAVPDFKKAARLAPQNYRVNAAALLFELGVNIFALPEAQRGGAMWNVLPEPARQSVGFGLSRLEQIAEGPDAREAAGAWEMLGLFQLWVQGDPRRAAASCRRAVALDPTRAQAWDAVIGLLAAAGNDEELLKACETRVRHRDTALNRLFLAKTYFRLQREEQAAEQVKLALQRAPDDYIAQLARAALLLRRPRDPAALNEAGRILRQAQARREAFAKAGQEEEQVRLTITDLAILSAAYAAFEDDFTSARQLVKQVLAADPNHAYAKEIQTALGR